MAKKLVPFIILLAFAMLAASVLAQQAGLEQMAEDKRFEASTLLTELNGRNFENQDAQESLMQANNAFDEGMMFFDNQDWQTAIDSFDNAIYLGGEAVVREEAGEIMDEIGLDIPWGDGIDIESIGQGVHPADLPILWGVIIVSIFVIMPVTYYLV